MVLSSLCSSECSCRGGRRNARCSFLSRLIYSKTTHLHSKTRHDRKIFRRKENLKDNIRFSYKTPGICQCNVGFRRTSCQCILEICKCGFYLMVLRCRWPTDHDGSCRWCDDEFNLWAIIERRCPWFDRILDSCHDSMWRWILRWLSWYTGSGVSIESLMTLKETYGKST